jgi:hypoxanthine phosphoribosyltransferase|tara:strand:+ start:167 stop:631 length:465 start_codon:yes stop_codon:yes gene_type:complete
MEKIYFKIEEMIDSIRNISEQLTNANFDPEVIISVNRGGCIPGIYLSHYIEKPHQVINLELRDSAKEPDLDSIKEKIRQFSSVLIIDDINDSGKTIGVIKDLSKNLTTKIHFAVLINKSESESKVEYYGKNVNSKANDYWYVFPWENWWKLNEK